jgi:hypothetical protein
MQLSASQLDEVLSALGQLLDAEQEAVRLIVVGGAALELQGLVERTTRDVDVIARADDELPLTLHPPEPLPATLTRAAARVARDFGLADAWLNTEIAAQWRGGLPPSITDDLTWHHYGGPQYGLHLGLAGRQTLVSLKLFAAVDRGPRSVHFQDLCTLAPSDAELDAAAGWVKTQDASPGFPTLVDQVVARVKSNRESNA